jgi:hypothetical protein
VLPNLELDTTYLQNCCPLFTSNPHCLGNSKLLASCHQKGIRLGAKKTDDSSYYWIQKKNLQTSKKHMKKFPHAYSLCLLIRYPLPPLMSRCKNPPLWRLIIIIIGVYLRCSCTFSFCDKFIFISLLKKVTGFNKCVSDNGLTKKNYFSHKNVNIKKYETNPKKKRKIFELFRINLNYFILFLNSCSTTLQT